MKENKASMPRTSCWICFILGLIQPAVLHWPKGNWRILVNFYSAECILPRWLLLSLLHVSFHPVPIFTMHCCFTYKPVVWAHSTVNHTNTFCHHLYLEEYDKVICDLSLHFLIQNNLHTIIQHHYHWTMIERGLFSFNATSSKNELRFPREKKKNFTKLSLVDFR